MRTARAAVRERLVRLRRIAHVQGAAAVKRVVLAVIALALVPTLANATPPALTYDCDPAPDDCSGWFRVPVQLKWDWPQLTADVSGGNCAKQTFTTDTKAAVVHCEVRDQSSGDTTGRTVTIRIDRTGPTITGPGLGRPPDSGEWFNHPVGFGFAGTDATSGIESCTGGTYGGPDGAGVSFSGTCRDVAGNVTSGAFTINYDATPPPAAAVRVLPGNRRVALRWESSQYLAEVVRVSTAAAEKVIYRGAGERFTDRGLRNGRRYRYVVTLIDQAGNRSSDAASAVPTRSPLLLPANGARLSSPPELVWKRVKRAQYYNAQLLFRGRKVLTRWPVQTRLQLPERWRSEGRRHRLVRGRYCWYVWPGYGPRRLRNYGELLGRSCFRITR
jgi:hypothetical protein